MEKEWVREPQTAAPDDQKPFVALREPGQQAEQWLELVTDNDVVPADLEFEAGQQWAQTQRPPQ